MYQQFFGLTDEPFGVSPDPRYFFATPQHAEAAAALYCALVERRGFAALIAAPGLGKTSVIVHLLERLKDRALVAMLVHPYFEANNLLESILAGFGVEPHADPLLRRKQLIGFLTVARISGKTCVVILDEAQNLTTATLEMIRMLSNFETAHEKLIQFVMVGQPALAPLLRRPESEQLRQRINVIARLTPLEDTQVEAYIAHRLRVAGASTGPFSEAAIRCIAQASAGVPRNINTLCFNALITAYGAGQEDRRGIGYPPGC